MYLDKMNKTIHLFKPNYDNDETTHVVCRIRSNNNTYNKIIYESNISLISRQSCDK